MCAKAHEGSVADSQVAEEVGTDRSLLQRFMMYSGSALLCCLIFSGVINMIAALIEFGSLLHVLVKCASVAGSSQSSKFELVMLCTV